MAQDSRPPRRPRPVVGSRHPTGRPRGVAGRRAPGPGGAPEPGSAQPESAQPESAQPEPVQPEPPGSPELAGRPVAGPRTLGSPRTTALLLVVLVLLCGVLAGEARYLWFEDEPVVSASRPVVTGEVAHRAAVEAARQSVADILSYGYQDFDEQVDEATSMMTDSFAEEFRQTADEVEPEFVAARTEQDVRVVAASVVQASSEQVQALLFLDQYVVKGAGGGPAGTTVTPYRALVTMVDTESGWLVADIVTR